MTPADLRAGLRLSQSAGWNQTEHDWACMLSTAPQACWVFEQDGEVVGTTTAITYGRSLAWVGMVLVLPEARRQGIARQLFAHMLADLPRRGIAWAGLDATELGVGLYESQGFERDLVLERWGRDDVRVGGEHQRVTFEPANSLLALDALAFGAGRPALLRRLAAVPGSAAVVSADGCALIRPGSEAAYLGPCTAASREHAAAVIERALARSPQRRVYWDIPLANPAAVELARALGFSPLRRLIRMWHRLDPAAAGPEPRYDLQYALAGFEYG